jgi:hypothetical protein
MAHMVDSSLNMKPNSSCSYEHQNQTGSESKDMTIPDLGSRCGKNFTFRDFVECSNTWEREKVDNTPKQPGTYDSMRQMAETVLDPIMKKFSAVKLTYAFSSPSLVKLIKETPFPNIHPPGDQHAGHELNRTGNPVCKRLGFAVDFYVPGVSSHVAAKWVIESTPFDRLYYYSAHRPFHVSVGPENNRSIVKMNGYKGGRHIPQRMTAELLDWVLG